MINTINSVVNTEFCSNYIMRKFAKQKKKKVAMEMSWKGLLQQNFKRKLSSLDRRMKKK